MAKKSAGGKKKKKSKEELEAERLLAEEEERKREEEEEKRRVEEEARKAEQEENERLERERLRGEELERLADEAAQTRALAERRQRQRDAFLWNRDKEMEWDNFVRCSALPSADSQADLNTYLETIAGADQKNMADVLAQCEELQQVIEAFAAKSAEHAALSQADRVLQCQQSAFQIFQTQVRRVDAATAHILAHAEDYVTPKMEVLQGHQSANLKTGVWVNLASKGFRMKIIDFPGVSIIAEIPKTLALQNIAVRVLQVRNDTITAPPPRSPSLAPGELADYDTAVGGCFFLEALKLPPPAKAIKGWNMRPINAAVEGRVERLNFNSGADTGAAPGSPDAGGAASVSVAVKFKLPRDVVVRDVYGDHCHLGVLVEGADQDEAEAVGEALAGQQDGFKDVAALRIGAWDPALGRWTEEGISEVLFDPRSRVVNFSTTRLTALAVLQRRCVDLPIRFWALKPLSRADIAERHAVNPAAEEADPAEDEDLSAREGEAADQIIEGAQLVLKTDLWLIRIEIRSSALCTLLEPIEPEFDGLRGVQMPAAQLFAQLAHRGINLQAPISDRENASSLLGGRLRLKNHKLEEHVYAELSAAVAASFSAVSSRWNQALGADKCCTMIYKASRSPHEAFDVTALMREHAPPRERLHEPDRQSVAAQESNNENNHEAGDADGATPESKEEGEGPEAGEAKTEEEKGASEDGSPDRIEEDKAGEEGKDEGEAPPTTRTDTSTPSKKKRKGGKKGKDKDAAAREAAEAEEAARIAQQEEEAKEDIVEEADPVPHLPRTVLFQEDEGAPDTKIKCAFIRADEASESPDITLAKDQVTHVYLENCLMAAGIYDEASVHRMQDDANATSLREAIANVLRTVRPLSLVNPEIL